MYVTRKVNATVVAAKLERLTRLGFTEAEPLGYVDGANLYEYVGGSPLNHTDAVGTQMAPLNPQSPQMAPPTIELPGRVDPLSIPHTPLEMMFGPRSSFMLPSTHVTGDPGRVPRPDPQRDPEGARIWDAEAGGVLKDVLAEVKRFDDYLLSLETVNSDCWWKCFAISRSILGRRRRCWSCSSYDSIPKTARSNPQRIGTHQFVAFDFWIEFIKEAFCKADRVTSSGDVGQVFHQSNSCSWLGFTCLGCGRSGLLYRQMQGVQMIWIRSKCPALWKSVVIQLPRS